MKRTDLKRLAIDGGHPVRTKPLPPYFPGAMVMGAAEKKAVLSVIDAKSPFRYYGPHLLGKVQKFEGAFTGYLGIRYALGVTSGTAALRVAIEALGIGPGDEVIVPAVTFVASPNAVLCARAVPVFADVDDTMSIDPDAVERLITSRTKAIMSVPILGVGPKMDRLRRLSAKSGIPLLEDVAQSCGASFRGKQLGAFGRISTFSLQLNKIITAGEGGVVVTADPVLYERAVRYHDQGQLRGAHLAILGKTRVAPFAGENYRMTELTAAIAAAQLRKLPSILRRMRAARSRVEKATKGMQNLHLRPSHDHEGDAGSSVSFLLDREKDAQWFVSAINAENISAFRLYDGVASYMNPQISGKDVASTVKCPYECPLYTAKVDYHEGLCPNAESLMRRSVCMGLPPVLTAVDTADIIKGIRKVYGALYEK